MGPFRTLKGREMEIREQGIGNREQGEARAEGAGNREGVTGARDEGEVGSLDVGGQDEVEVGAGEAGESGDELAGVRELILKAYPDVVAELVAGDSVDALLASVPAARDAYDQVAATIQSRTPTPTPIPTGSGRRPAIDPEGLSPEAKIQAGLRQLSL